MHTVHDWGEEADMTEREEQQMMCSHSWVANSGQGGEPVFRMNRTMSRDPLMHVMCSKCGARTWFSEAKWKQLPVGKSDG